MAIADDARKLPIRSHLSPDMSELKCAANFLAVFVVAKLMGAEFERAVFGDRKYAQRSAHELSFDFVVLGKQAANPGPYRIKQLKPVGVMVELYIRRKDRHQTIQVMRIERSGQPIIETHDLGV